MGNFADRLNYSKRLFIYIFKSHDYLNNNLNLYLFSLDGNHKYISLNLIGDNKKYRVVCGDLFINFKNNSLFIDNHNIVETIDHKEFKQLVRFYDSRPFWGNKKVGELKSILNPEILAVNDDYC